MLIIKPKASIVPFIFNNHAFYKTIVHTFFSVGVKAAFSHHIAFFILDGGRDVGNVKERIETETRRLVHLVLSLHGI